MDWTDEPATESQLGQLRRLGYRPEHPLTKGEAAHLIRDFEEHPERQQTSAEERVPETTKREAHLLRLAIEDAKRMVSEAAKEQAENLRANLALAIAKRHQFWIDTCREAPQRETHWAQVLDLYMKYGCRFVAPTSRQVQEILDALDAALPLWDRHYPEMFYETLKLNFPELLRHG